MECHGIERERTLNNRKFKNCNTVIITLLETKKKGTY